MTDAEVSAAGGKIAAGHGPDRRDHRPEWRRRRRHSDPSTPAPAGDTEVADVEIGDDALPTHIVLNVTREQLENAPAFRGIGDDVAVPMDAPATVPPMTAPAQ